MAHLATLQAIADGKPGLVQKVNKIRELVERAKRDPVFRQRVAALVHEVPEKDQKAEIARLAEFVKSNVRYLRDPWSPTGLELFIDPRTIMADVERGTAQGDCDDHVLLASAMLETAGYPTRYVVGGLPPDHYRHIWLEVMHPSSRKWLPIELTKKEWPTFQDPQGKFPLVERYQGGEMMSVGLGQSSGWSPPRRMTRRQRRERRLQRSAASMRARLAGRRRPQLPATIPGMRLADVRRARLQQWRRAGRHGAQLEAGRRARQHALPRRPHYAYTRAGLGDFDSPPSFHNTYEDDAVFAGGVPSDYFRAQEIRDMLPPHNPLAHSPLLGGLDGVLADYDDLGFLKKVGRKLKRASKKVGKEFQRAGRRVEREVSRTAKRVEKEAKRGVVRYGPEAVGIVATVYGGPAAGAALYAPLAQAREAYLASKEPMGVGPEIVDVYDTATPAPMPTPLPPATTTSTRLPRGPSLPASGLSRRPGPTFVEAAQGFALPPGVPDQVAIGDQAGGAIEDETWWDAPLPGRGIGSYIPTPPASEFPNAPPIDPFDMPADGVDGGPIAPGFGMGYGSAPWLGPESQADAAAAWHRGYDDLGDDDMENTFGSLGAESWLTELAKGVGQTVLQYQQARLQKRAAERGIPYKAQFMPPSVVTKVPQEPATPTGMRPATALALIGGGMLLFTMLGRRRR